MTTEIILLNVPNDITLQEIRSVMENCGDIKSINEYSIENMMKKEGKKDYKIEYETEEGSFVALQIGGTKYKHWTVKTLSVKEYTKRKQSEKEEKEFNESVEAHTKLFFNYLSTQFNKAYEKMKKVDTSSYIVEIPDDLFSSSKQKKKHSEKDNHSDEEIKPKEKDYSLYGNAKDSYRENHSFEKKQKPLPPIPKKQSNTISTNSINNENDISIQNYVEIHFADEIVIEDE